MWPNPLQYFLVPDIEVEVEDQDIENRESGESEEEEELLRVCPEHPLRAHGGKLYWAEYTKQPTNFCLRLLHFLFLFQQTIHQITCKTDWIRPLHLFIGLSTPNKFIYSIFRDVMFVLHKHTNYFTIPFGDDKIKTKSKLNNNI